MHVTLLSFKSGDYYIFPFNNCEQSSSVLFSTSQQNFTK